MHLLFGKEEQIGGTYSFCSARYLTLHRGVQVLVRTFVGGIDDLSGLEYHAKKPMRSVCPLELLFHVQRYQAFNQSLQIPSNALNVGFFTVKKLFLRNLIPERLPT